jgi:hypothetical protein
MSGYDLVRVWKDPDERGDAAHPAGEISLDDLSGAGQMVITLVSVTPARCPLNSLLWYLCPPKSCQTAICPPPVPDPVPFDAA